MASTCELLGGADGKVTTEMMISVEKDVPPIAILIFF